jgi:hypothetical protein
MDAAGGRRAGNGRGAPRLLEHCAALERMLGSEETSARTRLEDVLGGELAGLLCRALTLGPRRSAASLAL